MQTINYFGTDLTSAGHYFFEVKDNYMGASNLDFKNVPFNPEEMPRRDKGEPRTKGDVRFYHENGYTICAIEGAPSDDRWGTKSVFWAKEIIDFDKFMDILLSMPIVNRMI